LFLNNLPQWAIFLVAFAAGLVGALLALFFQRLAIIAAGFLGGGSLLLDAINLSGWQAAPVSWLIFLIGGFVGALLLYFLFDWTLIFLSSLIGADLIRQGIPVSPSMTAVVFFGLFIAGFIVQAKMMGPRNRK